MEFYAYMVTCADQSIYTGHADNLEVRLAAHNDGCTFTRRPVRLIFQTSFPTRQEAIEAERQIKGWSRAKKLALAEGDWELLERLSFATTAAEAVAMRIDRPPVHGSRASPRTVLHNPRFEYVPVRPEPVEGRTCDCDRFSRGRGCPYSRSWSFTKPSPCFISCSRTRWISSEHRCPELRP